MAKTLFYKGIRVNMFGIPVGSEKSRIKKSSRKRNFYYMTFDSPFKTGAVKNLIVMYDIPEKQKKERDWFRRQLRSFDYIMLQRSVWVGPSPLPKEFLDYVKMIGLEKKLRTFKLTKPFSSTNRNI